MKRSKSIGLACMVAVAVIATSANADVYTFQPYPVDLFDLEHSKYYTWKIDFSPPSGETITDAGLFFDNIRNYNSSDNELFVSLLPGSWLWDGLAEFDDTLPGHDDDNGLYTGHVPLIAYTLPDYATDQTYDFSSSEIGALNTYVSLDGNFGIGFDPDCHFYNDGVTLTIETAHAPVPGAVLLGSIGLSCSGWLLRKRKML